MDIPTWFNRNTIQMFLMVVVTFGVHYYFITNRLANHQAEENLDNAADNDDSIRIEQRNQA